MDGLSTLHTGHIDQNKMTEDQLHNTAPSKISKKYRQTVPLHVSGSLLIFQSVSWSFPEQRISHKGKR